jgi:PRTRC genetic system protein E
MFTELMPLLAGRTVLITVARESDSTVRATVIPKRAGHGENAALATPLSFVGTPAELDQNLGPTLAEYVETHQRVGSTLAQAKAEMEVAAKAAQEEAKRKAEERRKAKASGSSSVAPTSTTPTTPVKADPAQPASGGLFDGSPRAANQITQQDQQQQCRLSL